MSAPELTLYGYWRSSCSWRVRIALGLKGVPYRYEPVHLIRDGGEQHTEAYRRKNPLRQVPTLEITEAGETRRLTQSLAICRWLDARFPEPPLVSADPWLGARAWQLAEIVNASIQPLQNLAVLRRVGAAGVDPTAWAAEWIERGLVALEAETAEVAGRYSVGDAPGLADACLVPQLHNARRQRVDLSAFPTLLRVEAACSELDAFRRAHPDEQPDAQESA